MTWLKGTRDITNSQRTLKETSDDYVRFTLKRVTMDDQGTYCIMAKNVYGCDRAFVTIRVRQRARSLTPLSPPSVPTILQSVHDDMELGKIRGK